MRPVVWCMRRFAHHSPEDIYVLPASRVLQHPSDSFIPRLMAPRSWLRNPHRVAIEPRSASAREASPLHTRPTTIPSTTSLSLRSPQGLATEVCFDRSAGDTEPSVHFSQETVRSPQSEPGAAPGPRPRLELHSEPENGGSDPRLEVVGRLRRREPEQLGWSFVRRAVREGALRTVALQRPVANPSPHHPSPGLGLSTSPGSSRSQSPSPIRSPSPGPSRRPSPSPSPRPSPSQNPSQRSSRSPSSSPGSSRRLSPCRLGSRSSGLDATLPG